MSLTLLGLVICGVSVKGRLGRVVTEVWGGATEAEPHPLVETTPCWHTMHWAEV